MNTAPISIQRIREHFPAIAASPDVLLDNAGGAQLPESVILAVSDYMRSNFVQLAADYRTSARCTEIVNRAHEMVRCFMNAEGVGEVILGSSTSSLITMLAECYARAGTGKRDQVIVAQNNHEANAGPWMRLSERGFDCNIWNYDPDAACCPLETLRSMLCERTRLVAIPHVSNLLGGIDDIKAITRLAHEVGARVVVDGVAYAPHRAIDVKAWGVDWYAYSTYKAYAPHMAALFGSNDAIEELPRPSHFFIPDSEVPYKFEIGGPNHEGSAALLGLWPYLCFLAGTSTPSSIPDTFDRAIIERAFQTMANLELPLQTRLIEYLQSRADVRLIGPADPGPQRVPTISFIRPGQRSRDISERLGAKGVGVRYGHCYSYRLCEALGLDLADGVLRASMVHYTTLEEVDRLIDALDEIMRKR